MLPADQPILDSIVNFLNLVLPAGHKYMVLSDLPQFLSILATLAFLVDQKLLDLAETAFLLQFLVHPGILLFLSFLAFLSFLSFLADQQKLQKAAAFDAELAAPDQSDRLVEF
jgi:hypothetical protein